LIACEPSGTIDVYSIADGAWAQGFAGHVDRVLDLNFAMPTQLLRSVSADGSVRSWGIHDGRCLSIIPDIVPRDGLAKLAPDIRHLLVAADDGALQLYRLPEQKPFIGRNVGRDDARDTYDHMRSAACVEHIEAEHFSEGSPDVAYHDEDERNSGDGSRECGVDVYRDAAASAGEFIGDTHAGEWLHYQLTVCKPSAPRVIIARVRGTPGARFHLELLGQDISGPIVVPAGASAGEQWVITRAARAAQLQIGGHDLRVVFDTADGQKLELDWFGFGSP
jgi:hypothetical protein